MTDYYARMEYRIADAVVVAVAVFAAVLAILLGPSRRATSRAKTLPSQAVSDAVCGPHDVVVGVTVRDGLWYVECVSGRVEIVTPQSPITYQRSGG